MTVRSSRLLVRTAPLLAAAAVLSLHCAHGSGAHVNGQGNGSPSNGGSGGGEAPYATWAHSHFIWPSGEVSQDYMIAYVNAYTSRNLTVGAVDIDSGWSTGYDNFIPNTAANHFPNLTAFVDGQHAQNIRVILWMTSMINTDSSNFAEATKNNYVIRDLTNKSAVMKWWHGSGSLLDYTNPAARSWWEPQLDIVLKGSHIDGFKCDGAEPYMIELVEPQGYAGLVTFQNYTNWYYGHTYNYSRSVNPEALIWSRPVDSYPLFLNLSAFLEFSPKYVMFAGWVGDQDPTFAGLQDAMINILESAWANYTNFGSDIGGYRGGNRTAEVLIRWAQAMAFHPLMENGGDDEHRPWAFDSPSGSVCGSSPTSCVDIYRRLLAAHYELGPYLLNTGTTSFAAGISALHPLSAPPKAFPFAIEPDDVNDWSMFLGPDIYHSPILWGGVSDMVVTLPNATFTASAVARWGEPVYEAIPSWSEYWNASAPVRAGGTTFTYHAPLSAGVSPVFVRSGSILPLHVSGPLGGVHYGTPVWAAALTLAVHSPILDGTEVTKKIAFWEAPSMTASYSWSSDNTQLTWVLSPSPDGRPVILLARWPFATTSRLSSVTVGRTESDEEHPLTKTVIADPAGFREAARLQTPAAIAWDATTRAPTYPVGDLHTRLSSDFERDLAGTFFSVRGDGSDDTVFVSAADAAAGTTVRMMYTSSIQ